MLELFGYRAALYLSALIAVVNSIFLLYVQWYLPHLGYANAFYILAALILLLGLMTAALWYYLRPPPGGGDRGTTNEKLGLFLLLFVRGHDELPRDAVADLA